jgi:bisphosphoglycerate-dependent phosphoglycerate mutase
MPSCDGSNCGACNCECRTEYITDPRTDDLLRRIRQLEESETARIERKATEIASEKCEKHFKEVERLAKKKAQEEFGKEIEDRVIRSITEEKRQEIEEKVRKEIYDQVYHEVSQKVIKNQDEMMEKLFDDIKEYLIKVLSQAQKTIKELRVDNIRPVTDTNKEYSDLFDDKEEE